jgi:hypothetical protein
MPERACSSCRVGSAGTQASSCDLLHAGINEDRPGKALFEQQIPGQEQEMGL